MEYVVGDLVNGTGVQEAVAGAGVIIHCASAKTGDAEATQTLVKAATAQSRLPHLVYISIVGAEGIRFSYFKAKLAAEKIIVDSSLPWTVQRRLSSTTLSSAEPQAWPDSQSLSYRRTSSASRSTLPTSLARWLSSRSARRLDECPTSAGLKYPAGPK